MQRSVEHVDAVKAMVDDRIMRAIVYLVANNVPLSIAEALNAIELEAWCIILGEIKGAKYDWANGCWEGDSDE